VQLRHYSVAAANRDLLLAMVESTAWTSEGRAVPLGMFRDLDDDGGLVCLRVVADRDQREAGPDALEGVAPQGVAPEHEALEHEALEREALEATRARVDCAALLVPGWEQSGLTLDAEQPSAAAAGPGVVELGIVEFAAPVDVVDLMYFCDEVAPQIQAARGAVLACLVQRPLAAHLAGGAGNLLVWLAGFPWRSTSSREVRSPGVVREGRQVMTPGVVAEALEAWPGRSASPQVLRLQSTERSALTAASCSAFRTIYCVPRDPRPHDVVARAGAATLSPSPGRSRWPTRIRRGRRAG
jgi:hypothetical protein